MTIYNASLRGRDRSVTVAPIHTTPACNRDPGSCPANEGYLSWHSAAQRLPPPRSSARSAFRRPFLNSLRAPGMPSSSALAIMASPALLTWRAPANASWCSKAVPVSEAPVPSKSPSPASACRPALTLPDCCIRWWSTSLGLVERGFHWTPAVNGLFVPFPRRNQRATLG